MKKFSLNTKRAGKVLALALVAALVVPSVPAQQSSAASDGKAKNAYGAGPEAIATVDFSSKKQYVIPEGTTGEKIVFSEKTVTQSFKTKDGKDYQSKDKAPVTADGVIVREKFDTAPEVRDITSVTGTDAAINAKRGNVLSLKNSENLVQYPAAAPTTGDAIAAGGQIAKKYYSGVEVENPFARAGERAKLFKETRYNWDNLAKTATEVDAGDRRNINANSNNEFGRTEERQKYSKPKVEAGVTISFWAKTPVNDEDELIPTNFFEFANTESLVYHADDQASAYIAYMYNKMKQSGDLNNDDSPFYMGRKVEGTIVAVSSDDMYKRLVSVMDDYEDVDTLKKDVASGKAVFATYVDMGYYAAFNPKLVEKPEVMTITDEKGNTTRNLYLPNRWAGGTGGDFTLNVTADGNNYHMKKTIPLYAEGSSESILKKYEVTDAHPRGKGTKEIQGATGQLYMGTTLTWYQRDNNALKTGYDMNPDSLTYGENQCGQQGSQLQIENPEVAEAAADAVWHYYTITITDEWFQAYVDGEACDPTSATVSYQDKFNLGSGVFAPDGTRVPGNWNYKTDYQKKANDCWRDGAFMYGFMFGETVMSYITDPNTKLIIGGRTQDTSEGTLLDSFAFYDVVLDATQVKAEFDARKDVADPEPEPDVLLGDVDGNGLIEADDALAILKVKAGITPEKYVEEAADVDNNGLIEADDALGILKLKAGNITDFSELWAK